MEILTENIHPDTSGARPALQGSPAILVKPESAQFNSVEIIRVASETSKRFPGVRYVTVSVRSQHIQESRPLFRAKDLPVRDRARLAAA